MLLWIKDLGLKGSLCGILFVFCVCSNAQTTPYHINYTVQDGLPSNTVFALTQDKSGVMWFATANGVTSFDGFAFTNYDLSLKGLSCEALNIFCDHLNRIWFCDINGTFGFIQNGQLFSKKEMPFIPQLESAFIHVVVIPSRQLTYLVGSNTIYEINHQSVHKRIYRPGLTNAKFLHEHFNVWATDDSTLTIQGTYRFTYSITRHVLSQLHDSSPMRTETGLPGKFLISDYAKPNTLWYNLTNKTLHAQWSVKGPAFEIGGDSQLGRPEYFQFMNDTTLAVVSENSISCVSRTGSKPSLIVQPETAFTRIYKDHVGNLWCGTFNNGLFFCPVHMASFDITVFHNNIRWGKLTALDDHTSILYGAMSKLKMVGRTYTINESALYNLPVQEINKIYAENDNLYLCTRKAYIEGKVNTSNKGPKIVWNNFSKPIGNCIDVMHTENKTLCLMSQFAKVIEQGNPSTLKLPKLGYYTGFFTDSHRNSYVLSSSGIAKLEIYPDTIKTAVIHQTGYSDLKTLDNETLIGLTHSSKMKWLNGLDKPVIEEHLIRSPVGEVYTKIDVLEHRIYAATRLGFGLYYLVGDSLHLVWNIQAKNQHLPIDFAIAGDTITLLMDNRVMYIPISFQPAKLVQNTRVRIKKNSTYFAPVNDLYVRVDKSTNSADIQVFNPAFNIRGIRYYFAGEWIESSNAIAHLRNLKPGEHHLSIQVIDVFGRRLQPIALTIVNEVPLLDHPYTPWIAGMIILSLVAYLYNRMQRDRHRAQLELTIQQEEAVLSRIQALQSQISPHFTFNALNTFHYFVRAKQNDKAVEYLEIFSGLLRDVISSSGKNLIPLSQEINLLENYFAIEKLRLSNDVELDISHNNFTDLDKIKTPPMVLQPLVENAIQHGIARVEKGIIRIRIEKKVNQLSITITDNGPGYFPGFNKRRNHVPSGLLNVKRRIENLALMYKIPTDFTIENLPASDGPGTQQILTLPLLTT